MAACGGSHNGVVPATGGIQGAQSVPDQLMSANAKSTPAPTTAFTVYQVPTLNSFPNSIAKGPDGNLWFTETSVSQVGKITTSGTATEFPVRSGSNPQDITGGPDGAVWFTENGVLPANCQQGAIGRITTGGSLTEYTAGIGMCDNPYGIAVGQGGYLWFTESGSDKIAKISSNAIDLGTVTQVAQLSSGTQPNQIIQGPDLNVYATEFTGNAVAKVTQAGGIATEIPDGVNPYDLVVGPDGNIWFTETGANAIERLNPLTGVVTEFTAGITPGAGVNGITVGSDGNIYFTEFNLGNIGRFNIATSTVTEFADGIASSDPNFITTGPDGNLWFTDAGVNGNLIVKVVPSLLGVTSNGGGGSGGGGNCHTKDPDKNGDNHRHHKKPDKDHADKPKPCKVDKDGATEKKPDKDDCCFPTS